MPPDGAAARTRPGSRPSSGLAVSRGFGSAPAMAALGASADGFGRSRSRAASSSSSSNNNNLVVAAAESSERAVGGGVTGQAVRGPPPPRGRRLPPGLVVAPALPCDVAALDRGGGLDGLVGTRLQGGNSAGFALAFGV